MSKYINKITKKDIVKFLNSVGYCLNESIYDDMGEQVPPYEKNIDRKTKECDIVTRCSKINPNPILNKLSNLIKLTDNMYVKDLEAAVFVFTDYNASVFTLDSDANFQYAFAKFMYAKFGEEYKKDYNSFVKKQMKEQKEKDNSNGK